MKVLNEHGMRRLEEIQYKYKFKNKFKLTSQDVYEFCTDIQKAYYLGLCLDTEDLDFIKTVLEAMCSA